MKKYKGLSIITSLIISVIIFFGIISLGGGVPLFELVNKEDKNKADGINPSAVSAYAATLNSNYGAFADKSTYTFTDPDKVDGYRSGSLDSDTTTITVDSNEPHGSQKNPYVIHNWTTWRSFSSEMSRAWTATEPYGKDKFYVLATDLDFAQSGAPAAAPLNCFSGTFYGLGHTIKNFNYNNTSEEYCGFIRWTNAADGSKTVFTDLNLEYNFNSQYFIWCGAFIGYNQAAHCYILNCHATGSINRTVGVARGLTLGGIIGGITGEKAGGYNRNVLLYRCSAKVTSVITGTSTRAPEDVVAGGITGWNDADSNIRVYDCYADIDFTNHQPCTNYYASSILGSLYGSNKNGEATELRNCVGKIRAYMTSTTATGGTWSLGGLFAVREQSNNSQRTLTVENMFVTGVSEWLIQTSGKSGSNSLKPWIVESNGTSTRKLVIKTIGNELYYSGPGATEGEWVYGSGSSLGSVTGNTPRFVGTSPTVGGEAQLFSNAKNSSVLKPAIWKQKSNIGAAYSIANSPVINKLETKNFKVKVYDRKNNADTEVKANPYTAGASSITLTPPTGTATKEWCGYTYDANGAGDVFATLPNAANGTCGYYGDIKLYAVYDVPVAAASGSITVGGNGTEADGKITMAYDGLHSVTLTANITPPTDMSDAEIDYRWTIRKSDGTTATNNQPTVSCLNVADSGDYTLEYKIKSRGEPLWRSSDWRNAGTKTVEITGQDVSLRANSFRLNGTAYVGMPLSGLSFTAIAENNRQVQVPAEKWEWKVDENPNITETEVHETDGKYYVTKQIIFYPSDSNYGRKVFDVEVEVHYIKFVFKMSGMADDIEVNAVYGQNYTYAEIADMFETEYLKRLDAGGITVAEQEPWFEGKSISDYRKQSGTVTLTENKTVNGEFKTVEYTVTFDWGDGTLTEKYGYGIKIPVRDRVEVPSGAILTAWKFTDKTGTEREWRFEATADGAADYVTGDVTLTAEILELKLTLTELKVTLSKRSYPALTQLTNADLTVKGVFDTEPNIGPYETALTLNAAGEFGYKITYESGNNLQASHTQITVSYNVAGIGSLTKDVQIAVTKIPVDFSNSGFKDATAKYTGADLSASAPKILRVPKGIDSKLADITYEFSDEDGSPVSEIIGDEFNDVTYTVKAILTVNANYEVNESDLTVNFKITAAAEEVYLVWDEDTVYEYNGEVQYPKAKAYTVIGDEEVTGVIYSGDTDAVVPGSYRVTASLGSAYTVTGDDGCNFTIKNAVLAVPTVAGNTYNGGVQTVNLNGYDEDKMSLGGTYEGTDAASYTATVTLNQYYEFENGDTSADIEWEIAKAELFIVWSGYKFEADGNPQRPEITSVTGYFGSDSYADGQILVVGEAQTEIGSYEVNATIDASATWANNYRLRNPKRTFAVLSADGMNKTLIVIEWSDTSLTFIDDNTPQHPTAVVKDMEGNELTGIELTFGGDYNSSLWAGEYRCTASANGDYFIVSGGACEYTITKNSAGEGEDPNKNNNGGNGGFGLPENFPLWQIITAGVSVLLILVLLGKCASYAGRIKKAKKKAERSRSRFYAGSVLPVFSTVTVLFGMSNMVWSIIAFGCAGVMLILLIIALIMRGKCVKAEDAAEEAAAEDMKMMFMGMMSGMRAGNNNAAPPQQDTAQIVKDVVAALLPQMQAMLPAGSVVLNAAPAVGVAATTATVMPADYDADEEDWGEVDDEDDVFDPNESATTEVEADPTVFETVDGKQPRVRSNFRVRLKATTDKNRGTYVTIKNYLNAQKHVTFRMSGRIEKVKHGGEVIAVIGIAKKSLKIWLALNPNNYDVKRYYHKDVSEKPRFAETPMLIRVASERGIKRACELFDDLFTKFNVEARKNYEEKGLIELAFTLKQNPLFKDKRTELIRMSVTDDAANKAISDSAVNEYILRRERVPLEEEKFATVSLDAIDKEFLDGQKVTLQKLQAKGIVGEEFNGYKVTRGEKLTKPLCIIADGISATAAKMIVLTGGIALKLVNPDELDDKK